MVGVGHAVFCDLPRLSPAHARIVHENAHQLRDGQRGVGIVYLNDIFLVEVPQGAVHLQMLAGNGLDGGRNKEILLLQAQGFALVMVILRIQDLADGIGHGALLTGLEVLSPAEKLHIHRFGASGLPEPEGVHMVGVIAGDLHVAGYRQHTGIVLVDYHQLPAVPLGADSAAKMHLLRLLRAGHKPCAAHILPVIRQLHLLALHDLLLENTQLIADGVARGRNFQSGHAVQIAGGQTAQTTVAETGVRLLFKEVRRLEAKLLHRLSQLLHKAKVIGIFQQTAAHEKLQGQVMYLSALAFVRILPGSDISLGHHVPQDHGAGPKHIPVPCLPGSAATVNAQSLCNRFFQSILGHLVLLVFSVIFS